MARYESIRKKIIEMESSLKTVTPEQLEKLKTDFPSAPEDYYDFLKEVGFGRVGNGNFQFYDGFVYVDEIYGYSTEESDPILLFGDDYQGHGIGYNPKDYWVIVEVDPSDLRIRKIAINFEEFIRNLIEKLG